MEKSPNLIKSRPLHGIMQGRLTRPQNKILQFFPKETWRNEFDLAQSLGFSQIQGVIDSDPITHPLLHPLAIDFLLSQRQTKGVIMSSVCLHWFVEFSFWEFKMFGPLFSQMKTAGIEQVVFPLEGASRGDHLNPQQRLESLSEIGKTASDTGIQILLETTALEEYAKTLASIQMSSLALCFDTGNVSFDRGVEKGIDLFKESMKWIKGIHLKDRNIKGENVPFGKGLVQFSPFMELFLNQNMVLIHESYRGMNDDPITMASNNLRYLQERILAL